jgi:hypothetical protein
VFTQDKELRRRKGKVFLKISKLRGSYANTPLLILLGLELSSPATLIHSHKP